MRLFFIRHGDPDYENDTLTAKGKREAELLADQIHRLEIDEVYQSPLGRAKDTAAYSLKKLEISAVTYDWLMEFPVLFDPNLSESASMAYKTELKKDQESGKFENRIVWDVLPSYFGSHPELFDRNGWRNSEIVKSSNMVEKYEYVRDEFLNFLSDHGYKKDGDIYRVTAGNSSNVAFFCHFGITSVLLSILWNVSPFIPLQYMATAPTSVTEVVTEEREEQIAIFRTLRVGDITHLAEGNEKPSFSARFCEQFMNENERH